MYNASIRVIALLVSMGSAGVFAAEPKGAGVTEIVIMVDGAAVTATLDNSATAKDFLSLLPFTVKLEDYHNAEKIGDLPRRLTTEGAPSGIDPKVGDITYYAPWGNLAIFYRDFGYADGLIRLGHIHTGIDRLQQNGTFTVTIRPSD